MSDVNVHSFKVKTADGAEADLGDYAGDALLVVNVASKCGLTPQYAGLEALHREFADRGLRVLGFPCNQFGGQEPGTAEEIAEFCSTNYDVSFPIFAKIDVNGPDADPLYDYLRGDEDIRWNFAKFLIGRDGEIIKRYDPKVTPEEIRADLPPVLN